MPTFPLKIRKAARDALAGAGMGIRLAMFGQDGGRFRGSEICWRVGVEEDWNVNSESPRACLRGQVGSNMNDVIGDHTQSDPTPNAGRSSV